MVDRCRYCGSDEGYYIKSTQIHSYFYTFDGEPDGESEPREIHKGNSFMVYCRNCDRIIGRTDTFNKDAGGERDC